MAVDMLQKSDRQCQLYGCCYPTTTFRSKHTTGQIRQIGPIGYTQLAARESGLCRGEVQDYNDRDGLIPEAVAFDGVYGSGATIDDCGQDINGYIGPVAIYNYQMTDAELQAITA